MKTASNSGCRRSPNRKTLNIASFTAVRCAQRYEIRFFPGATSTNSCSSEQLKHNVPTRFITCSHDEIVVWMSASSEVQQLDALLGQQNICGLQVAMGDALLVSCVERITNLRGILQCLIDRQRSLEGRAFDV